MSKIISLWKFYIYRINTVAHAHDLRVEGKKNLAEHSETKIEIGKLPNLQISPFTPPTMISWLKFF